jgi:hypothetical protein
MKNIIIIVCVCVCVCITINLIFIKIVNILIYYFILVKNPSLFSTNKHFQFEK